MGLLQGIRLILVEPEMPGNVGACARLCENFGVEDWVLVRPRCSPGHEDARRLAVDSSLTRLENVRITDDLTSAIADCQEAVGFTRRARGRSCAPLEWRLLPSACESAPGRTTALVFGNERTGLENRELSLCSRRCELPTDPALPSLNLSHAVASALVRIADARVGLQATPDADDASLAPATRDEVERLFAHWRELLIACQITQAGNPDRMLGIFRSLLSRTQLMPQEVRALRAVFHRALTRLNAGDR